MLRWISGHVRRERSAQLVVIAALVLAAIVVGTLALPLDAQTRFNVMVVVVLAGLVLAGGYIVLRAFGLVHRLSAETIALRERLDQAHAQMTLLQRSVREERQEQVAQTERLIAGRLRDVAVAAEAARQQTAAMFDGLTSRIQIAEAGLMARASAAAALETRVGKAEASSADAAQTAARARGEFTAGLDAIAKRMGAAEAAIAARAGAAALDQLRRDMARLSDTVAAGDEAGAKSLAAAEQARQAALAELAGRISDLAKRLGELDSRAASQADKTETALRADLQAARTDLAALGRKAAEETTLALAELGGRIGAVERVAASKGDRTQVAALEAQISRIASEAKAAGTAGAAGLAALDQKLAAAQADTGGRVAEIIAAADARAAETGSALAALKAGLTEIIGVAKAGAQAAANGIASARQEIADLLARVEESEDAGVAEVDKLSLRLAALESPADRETPAVDAQVLAVLRSQVAEAVSLSEQAARQTFAELAGIKAMSDQIAVLEARHTSLARALEAAESAGVEEVEELREQLDAIAERLGVGAGQKAAAEGALTPANDPHGAAQSKS